VLYFFKWLKTQFESSHSNYKQYLTINHFDNSVVAVMLWIWTLGPKKAVAGRA